MKVIFLDVDGVLNSNDFYTRRVKRVPESREDHELYQVDPLAVERLNRLTHETEALIVLSSTWRLGRTRAQVADLFNLWGIKAPCIGMTGRLDTRFRGDEIKEWLEAPKPERYGPLESYVIIDDDRDMLAEQWDNFVKTDWMFGLTDEDVEKAIKILNKDYSNGTQTR